MKRLREVIIAALVVGVVLFCCAFGSKDSYSKSVEKFMAALQKGEIDAAYDGLLTHPGWAAQQQQVAALKEQTQKALTIYGQLLGYEFVKEQKYGKSLVRLVYVMKSEQKPLTWEFYFYKANSDWEMVNFNFNDKYDLLADK
jgi:ABC-type transport system substrate-binding protein